MPLSLKESICRAGHLPRTDDILMGRAELLSRRDRDLVEAVLMRGQSSESLARLMGVSARTVRRRLHLLGRRLVSRRFLHAARALPYLSPEDAELARLKFCACMMNRQICRRLNLSPYVLRKRLEGLRARIEMIHHMARLSKAHHEG